jgi:FlaA1/EpsC-like NDP-sugar epimerase
MRSTGLLDNPWQDRVVLLTGVAGSVGHEMLAQLVARGPRALIATDNNESALYFVQQEFAGRGNLSFVLADICDPCSLTGLMEGVDIVIHAAAFKHVPLCEAAPRAAIQTNILGTQNVIQAAQAAGVKRVLFTSSDKAVNPTNVMGTSKLMAERLMVAAHTQSRSGRTLFASTRFGNVLGSRGSVIPLFRQQIAAGGPVTLTHPDMTRFIMTLSEAVDLVLEAAFLAKGGEIFVTKMPVCRIEDLAVVMVQELAPYYGRDPRDLYIEVVGPRPGEKFYEELMNEEESRRVVELENYYVIVPPSRAAPGEVAPTYSGTVSRGSPLQPYNSARAPCMSREDLRTYLQLGGYLPQEDEDHAHLDLGGRRVLGLANGHALSDARA